MPKLPRTITLLIDSREQRPLLFPEILDWYQTRGGPVHTFTVRTKVVALPAGDYALDGYDDAIIERKGSLRELRNNFLSDDYRRAQAAFTKLTEATENPYLLLDIDLAELLTPSIEVEKPEIILDAFLDFAQASGVKLLIVGGCKRPVARCRLGGFVIRLLLSHCMRSIVGPIDISSIVDAIVGGNINGP